jgi:hypothetical protein
MRVRIPEGFWLRITVMMEKRSVERAPVVGCLLTERQLVPYKCILQSAHADFAGRQINHSFPAVSLGIVTNNTGA